ncbi:major facilitator superfamily permease 11 [Thermococcus cleftensis]|uniref:Major facilitator superfamily permease 11 n=1 Tax=Thermococcus cleftensis (strain DSM 27260 / KACC 17922 / CL1) TaxID=163003 RepID=I3ZV42_THECF|nr:MFS transporter [Thermococcus cleftensis]AFL95576.1 major facilitator superfamily permease 11 [Thermococcus cleftensis]
MKRERAILQGRREKAGKLRRLKVKRKNVLLLAVSMFLANVSFGMAFPYLSVYMRLIGGTMLMVGLLSVAFNLTSTAFQYPFGYLSDSTRNRKGFIALGLFSTGFFYALMALVSTPLALLALRTAQGALGSAMMPAKSALIAELSTRIGSAYGLFSTVENAGYMSGNFLGGFLVKRIGIRGIFVLSGVLLAVSAVIALAMRERPRPKRAPRLLLIPQEGRESDRATVGKKALGRLMRGHLGTFYLSVLLMMIASGQVYSVVPVYFGETFGEEWVGLLFGIDSLAAALSGYYIGRLIDRYGAKRFYLLSIAGYGIAFLGYAFAESIYLMLPVAFLSGVKWSMTLNSASTYVAERVRVSERGQGMGLLNAMMSLGWVLGPLLGGYLSGISFTLNFVSTLIPLGLAFVLAIRLPG